MKLHPAASASSRLKCTFDYITFLPDSTSSVWPTSIYSYAKQIFMYIKHVFFASNKAFALHLKYFICKEWFMILFEHGKICMY